MRCSLALALVLACLAVLAPDRAEAKKRKYNGIVVLNGVRMGVRWSDGDSFKFTAGPHKKRGTRLAGFNTLESYGPVHRWGDWTAAELFAIATSSAEIAVTREWNCRWDGKADGYGRMLIDCPDLSKEMIRQGHGMAFTVEGEADPELLKAQRQAQKEKKGMWAKGVPAGIVSSLHSAHEKDQVYNRVVDTRSGAAKEMPHAKVYETCQEVCVGEGKAASCLVYVPFEARYRDKPECLKVKKPAAP